MEEMSSSVHDAIKDYMDSILEMLKKCKDIDEAIETVEALVEKMAER